MRLLHVAGAEDMENLLARGDQIVRDDPAMASPPEAFRAHDGGRVECPSSRRFSESCSGSSSLMRVIGIVVKARVLPERVDVGEFTPGCFPRSPPSAARCSYAIPCAAREAGKTSRLNCGLVRERGTVRTSTTSLTSAVVKSATNSSIGRVECPMVKKGLDMLLGGLSRFPVSISLPVTRASRRRVGTACMKA